MNEIDAKTSINHRYVTAYLPANAVSHQGNRCGRVHVRVMEKLFPSTITSCSRLLLSEKEKVREMFEYLSDTCDEEVFPRYITKEGIMIKREAYHFRKCDLASSFIGLLEELESLLFSDGELVTKGGACYGGVIVPLSHMLVQYWKTGETHRYDISGPDMIHYATTKEHQHSLSMMLAHLRKWNPQLVPKNITVHMPMGTVVRIGYIKGHVSENVMQRRLAVSSIEDLESEQKRVLKNEAQHDEVNWPSQISPAVDAYFSQHDVFVQGGAVVVDDFWRNMPLGKLEDVLMRARNKLLSRK